MPTAELLEAIKARKSRSGIVTADRYFREVEGCFDGGFCPVKHVGAQSDDQWRKALKEAESKLTYSIPGMRVDLKSFTKSKDSEFIAEFDAVITTTRRDRDGDCLETKGCEQDKDGPLLWQHVHMAPIGRGIKVLKHTASMLKEKLGVVDTALGLDAVKLIKARVLRISHGFEPVKFEPMEDEQGWHFLKWIMFERSVVSIPSNIDAVITEFSGKSFRSDLAKGWYEGVRKGLGRRKSSVATVPADVGCRCKEHATATELVGDGSGEALAALSEDGLVSVTLELPVGEIKTITAISEVLSAEEAPRTFEEIEREYLAALAKSDIGTLRRSGQAVSLMVRAAEQQQEAREWDSVLSQLIPNPA